MDEMKRLFTEGDTLAARLGIELLDVAPGSATARMTIGQHHRNAYGTAHGGAIFSLADVVFAAASNAHGKVAVAVHADISYLRAAREGVLTARARERSLGNRMATYDIDVTDAEGQIVAVFRGTVYRKSEPVPGMQSAASGD